MKKIIWLAVIAAGFLAILAGMLKNGVKETAAHLITEDGMLNLTGTVTEPAVEHPKAALTFDDGPSSTYTPLLLDGLKARGVHATFFVMGMNIEGNEDILRRMQAEGHLIGNHTYNHVQLNKIPQSLACEEILKTSNAIYEVTGTYPTYIRPPFGAWQENLDLCVTMLPVFWDVDTLDWESRNVDSIMQIIKSEVRDGVIILMHDEYQTSVDAALQAIDYLQEQGYEFVTVDELITI